MNKQAAQLLECHFDTAFAAPNGIKKLRELILTLAMQGKLVAQDPNDPPASELLKEIEAEKRRLVKAEKIKVPKPQPGIKPEEVSYQLPKGWDWVRLGSVGNIFNGNSINASEKEAKYAGAKGLPYIATKDVGYGFAPLDYENGICIPVDEDKFRVAHEGAVLLCAEGGSAGKKCGLTDRDICFGNKLFANELYGQIPSRFILYTYLSPVFRASFAAAMTGIIGGVSIVKFVEIPVPLPPLKEQRRIVAKIDQLMARCDELEKLRAEREQKRLSVHTAALKKLMDATSPSFPRRRESSAPDDLDPRLRGGDESFANAWKFITLHFGELYSVKENVTELRKAILQLAVMGRLVPQYSNDPPASELLKEIEAEKQRLHSSSSPRRRGSSGFKGLDSRLRGNDGIKIKPEEVPYQLPMGWEWARFESFMPEYQNGISKRSASMGIETIVVRLANIINNEISLIDTRRIRLTKQEQSKYLLHPGDILITRVNGSVDLVGSIIRVRASDSTLAYCDHFIRVRLHPNTVDVDYLHAISKGALIRRQIEGKFITTAGQKTVNQTHISTLMFPLPPLPEQHRIVAKIDQLMAHCDELDKQIEAASGKQSALLNAVMAQV